MEQYKESDVLEIPLEKLKETKIVDAEGKPLVMYNRSHIPFETFELGKRNLENKTGSNEFGFFFSSRVDLEHYGEHVQAKYLNIENPWNIEDLGYFTDYKQFREKLQEIGIENKDLAGYDLSVQEMIIKRNKQLSSVDGLHTPGNPTDMPLNETRIATFNFFDAGDGYYLRK